MPSTKASKTYPDINSNALYKFCRKCASGYVSIVYKWEWFYFNCHFSGILHLLFVNSSLSSFVFCYCYTSLSFFFCTVRKLLWHTMHRTRTGAGTKHICSWRHRQHYSNHDPLKRISHLILMLLYKNSKYVKFFCILKLTSVLIVYNILCPFQLITYCHKPPS